MHIRFNSTSSDSWAQDKLFFKKVEYAHIKRQLKIIATFLPNEVLTVVKEDLEEQRSFVGVNLVINFSGLAQLIDKYNKQSSGGLHKLTATLNTIYGSIIEIGTFFGADVLSFCSEYMFLLWKVTADESLANILHETVKCSLNISKHFGTFETEVNVPITIKQYIFSGNLSFNIIEHQEFATFYVIRVNETILRTRFEDAYENCILVSFGTWQHMKQDRYDSTVMGDDVVKISKILHKPNEIELLKKFYESETKITELIKCHMDHRNYLHSISINYSMGKEMDSFIKSLPPRKSTDMSPDKWLLEKFLPFMVTPLRNQINESQPVEYMTEMRMSTLQHLRISLNPYDLKGKRTIPLIFENVVAMINEYMGVMTKMKIFNNIITFLNMFGLQGLNHELESQNVLKLSHRLRDAIEKIQGVENVAISIVKGYVYCGVVGHPLRREFMCLGLPVMKAIKMSAYYPTKITCDLRTFKHSKLPSYSFTIMQQGHNKQHQDLNFTNIFDYKEIKYVEHEDETHIDCIGRDNEINLIFQTIKSEGNYYYGLCFQGSNSIGKSTIFQYTNIELRKIKEIQTVSIQLTQHTQHPYFCVSKLYRQLYDKFAETNIENVKQLFGVPRDLWDCHEEGLIKDEDIALQKYRILNNFRNIVKFQRQNPLIILIDDLENIDLQSWEILDILLVDKEVKLISFASFQESSWDLKFKLSVHENILLIEMGPIKQKFIPEFICLKLNIIAVPIKLLDLIGLSCEGKPGVILNCLLRLINTQNLELKMINSSEKDPNNYLYLHNPKISEGELIPIIEFNENYHEDVTLTSICFDLFGSFQPYEQFVIKTGAVLGEIFTRNLLIITLKYPPEEVLAKIIKKLFDENIFDCGSNYLYGLSYEHRPLICRCYFPESYKEEFDLPRYAFCKILHFKNRNLRHLGYDLIPESQRRALHMLCTNVIENTRNLCPQCLKDPINSFVNFIKYDDIINYCIDIENTNKEIRLVSKEEVLKIQLQIKKHVIEDAENEEDEVGNREYPRDHQYLYDYRFCNCFEVLSRISKDLMYHSEHAGHLTKQIFFTLQYGNILICLMDLVNAMSVLNKARELCLINAGESNCDIPDIFRRLIVGRIQMGLTKAAILLRQYSVASNHIAIALRQYYIPTMALKGGLFRSFLFRRFLIKQKPLHSISYKNTILRYDLGSCLSTCGKLFAIEGNWKLAKLACSYSLYILRGVSSNVSVLTDVYSNAIEIYNYVNDYETCILLQKQAAREIQRNYARGYTFNLSALQFLLNTMFELRSISGDIKGALRLGFRVLDINMKTYAYIWNFDIIVLLSQLLLYVFRIKESGDLITLLNKTTMTSNQKAKFVYYAATMTFYLSTGFYIEPCDVIINFAQDYYSVRGIKYTWDDLYFTTLISLYYMRNGRYQEAENWRKPCSFNENNVKKISCIRTLMLVIEYKLLYIIRLLRMENSIVLIEEKTLKNLLALLKYAIKNHFPLYAPFYCMMKAWHKQLHHKTSAAMKLVKECEKIATKQENTYCMCFCMQLRNTWKGGYYIKQRPEVNYRDSGTYTLLQFAHFIPPYEVQ